MSVWTIVQVFRQPIFMDLIKSFFICALLLTFASAHGKTIELLSPDRAIKVDINVKDKIYYSISAAGSTVISASHLSLKLSEETLGQLPVLKGIKRASVKNHIEPYVALKYSRVENTYNSLVLYFKDSYSVEFRAFNDGVAYRFLLDRTGQVEVKDEGFNIGFDKDVLLHLQETGGFKTAYEEPYKHITSSGWSKASSMATLPLLADTKNGFKVLISEAGLSDYPCMFLKAAEDNRLVAAFPKVPLEFGPDGDRSVKLTKEADYIARTAGKRAFPWRYFVITQKDTELIENTMTLKLSDHPVIKDPSWVRPGQASWEWWNDASPYGEDVDFVSGYNLDTYKYYIDFAAKYSIPYIIMDEGWAKSTENPYEPNPNVDLMEVLRYGKQKNVGIVLWLTWLTVDRNMGLFEKFSKWGVKGVKIDFMDRSDQWMVNFYERVAAEAAKHKLFVDFHGSFKPAGLEYKYPNVLSYEGVRGMEQMGDCVPDNSIYFPFIRNAVGPMDYTPGAMISMQPEVYSARRPNAASVGTRAYQLALFVLFESGLQMLADNPTLYYKNPDCTEFITRVPVTWDETKALLAEVGEVAVVAKRKGDKWFIGGMTNGRKPVRDVKLDFKFLDLGKTYTLTYFEDGVNAGRQAMDYRKKVRRVTSTDELDIKMVRNGGWAAVIE